MRTGDFPFYSKLLSVVPFSSFVVPEPGMGVNDIKSGSTHATGDDS